MHRSRVIVRGLYVCAERSGLQHLRLVSEEACELFLTIGRLDPLPPALHRPRMRGQPRDLSDKPKRNQKDCCVASSGIFLLCNASTALVARRKCAYMVTSTSATPSLTHSLTHYTSAYHPTHATTTRHEMELVFLRERQTRAYMLILSPAASLHAASRAWA